MGRAARVWPRLIRQLPGGAAARGAGLRPVSRPSHLCSLSWPEAEQDATGLPAGAQDPYVAAFGGFRVLDVAPDGGVAVRVPMIWAATVTALEERLLLAYTGLVRGSTAVLAAQRDAAGREGSARWSPYTGPELGYLITGALEDGDLDTFGSLLTPTGGPRSRARR